MTELQTGVDQLMKLVKEKKKISVTDAAKELKVPVKSVQSWVDFLVEEHVLGVEYKFTTPYVYVNSEERMQAVEHEKKENYSLKDFKDVFYSYAQTKNMPAERLPHLWHEHVRFTAEGQKDYFLEECQRRGVNNAVQLYKEYVEELLHGA